MKKYKVYKNIRKRAAIFGLSLPLFALMMISIVASLLVIIFSFNLGIIIGAVLFNAGLYSTLTHRSRLVGAIQISRAFPRIISNKRNSSISYEED